MEGAHPGRRGGRSVGWLGQAADCPWRLPGPGRAAEAVPLAQPVRHVDLADRGRAARCRRRRGSGISRPARRTAPTTTWTIPGWAAPAPASGATCRLRYAYPEPEPDIIEPNPRTISRELLTRETVPAGHDPQRAGGGLAPVHDPRLVQPRQGRRLTPLGGADSGTTTPGPRSRCSSRAPSPDPTRPPDDSSGPPTYLNTETHWWDGSQLYGSNAEMQKMVRSGEDGKLRLDENGMLPRQLLEQAGQEPGFWVGLALFQTLFAREHNAVCDRLRAAYPSWSDDDLFDKRPAGQGRAAGEDPHRRVDPGHHQPSDHRVRAAGQLVGRASGAADGADRPEPARTS